MVPEALIGVIARKLFADYAKRVTDGKADPNRVLKFDGLVTAVTKLVEDNLLHLKGKTEESEFTPALLKHVITSITNLQLGTGSLTADGVLGRTMLKWLHARPFGHHPPRALNQSSTSSDPSSASHTIRYFVEGGHFKRLRGLSSVGRAFKLLAEAWGSWQDVCFLNVKQSGNRTQANVVITVDNLSGQPQSVLAVADIGPPGKRQLELTFDISETWGDFRFQACAAHEIGHLLGLNHLTAPRSLMNDTLHEGITTPQSADIKKVVSIWGKPKT